MLAYTVGRLPVGGSPALGRLSKYSYPVWEGNSWRKCSQYQLCHPSFPSLSEGGGETIVFPWSNRGSKSSRASFGHPWRGPNCRWPGWSGVMFRTRTGWIGPPFGFSPSVYLVYLFITEMYSNAVRWVVNCRMAMPVSRRRPVRVVLALISHWWRPGEPAARIL